MKTDKFTNPSEEIRKLMIIELENDLGSNSFYIPKTIHQDKIGEYKNILKEFFKTKSLNEFTTMLKNQFINWFAKQKDGKQISNDSDSKLAEGEWGKYYQKAVCQLAIEEEKRIKIWRWKSVSHPKNIEGFEENTKHDPKEFYSKINNYPLGANSGLTIEIID